MSTSKERAVEIMMETNQPPKGLDCYVQIRREIELAIAYTNFIPPSDSFEYFLTTHFQETASLIDLTLSSDSRMLPAVRGAMLMAAFAWRARVYSTPTERKRERLSFADNFRFSRYSSASDAFNLAKETETLVDEVSPHCEGRFTTIDLKKLGDAFWDSVQKASHEFVVVTGLNGAGKSVIVQGIKQFVGNCGGRVCIQKFPRPDGNLAGVILPVLEGKTSFDQRALQFLMLADALNTPVSSGQMVIFDRHPLLDSIVYGPEQEETVLLAARELYVDTPFWSIWVDRHPANCRERVSSRPTASRAFEKSREDMTRQQIKFGSLTMLPGMICVNNDIPETSEDSRRQVLNLSIQRAVASLITRGVIQRELVRQGVCPDIVRADNRVNEQFITSYREGFAQNINV